MTSLTVVVPAHQAEETLPACLAALDAAGFPPEDILVVDDGSTDGTGDAARAARVRVIRNDIAQRPARARNIGVAACDSEIVLFVDADVVVHDDIRGRLLRHFDGPGLDAVIGSYDDCPPAQSTVSRYRNLLHHYTHQRSGGAIQTFWTGLGAVRRRAFLDAGGLASEWENIEDVEFGLRLSARGGTILLDPEIQGAHLKDWTWASMLRTDLHGRAVPWTRLLRSGRAGTGSLNTAPRHQAAALAVLVGATSLMGAVIAPGLLWVTAAALAAFVAVNAGFLALLWRRGGAALVATALPAHAAHYGAALLGYARVRLLERA